MAIQLPPNVAFRDHLLTLPIAELYETQDRLLESLERAYRPGAMTNLKDIIAAHLDDVEEVIDAYYNKPPEEDPC